MAPSTDLRDLAVIVVNYASATLLSANLAKLTGSSGVTAVVVDNFSSHEERARVLELARVHGWLVETPSENLGFGAGMNLGVARARSNGAAHFLLLNPDAVIDSENVHALLQRTRAEPMTMVSPVIYRPDGSVWFAGSDLYLDDGRVRSLRHRITGARVFPWLTGACLLLSAQLWSAIGGFSDQYFLYWEDVDLSARVMAAGGGLAVVEHATALHAEGGTQGAGARASGEAKSLTYYYYNIRNRLVYASLHASPADARRWSRVTPRVAWEVLLQGGRRQFLGGPAPLWAAWRGVRDGRRYLRQSRRVSRATVAPR